MEALEERRIFLVATARPERAKAFAYVIQKHISQATTFFAEDGPECLFKIENFPPHVLVIDSDIPKQTGFEIVNTVLADARCHHTAMILISAIPDKEHFVDEIVLGRVQFLEDPSQEDLLNKCLSRALNFVATDSDVEQEYHLHFLTPGEILFKRGEKADSVYIVKKGQLEAFVLDQGREKLLGLIELGEFVGEMAHINEEDRSATVRAKTDCELIEIPAGKLDMVLFKKPAWSKALVQTLSRRLKRTNQQVIKS